MSSFEAAYATLGLSNGSPFDQVKKAYRKLVVIHHPDKNGGKSSEMFLRIQAAYELFEKRENPGPADLPHPEDVVEPPMAPPRPPPRAPPRPANFMGGFAEAFRQAANEPRWTRPRETPSPPPEPVHKGRQPMCKHGIRCTYYGCKFTHLPGHVAPEFPNECRFGWICRGRGTTCKFLHTRVLTERKGQMTITTTNRTYQNVFGAHIDITTTTSTRVY